MGSYLCSRSYLWTAPWLWTTRRTSSRTVSASLDRPRSWRCLVRPVLTPAVRRLWRDRETLQLGRGRTTVLAGVDPGVRSALALLDGTRDHDQVVVAAAAVGCAPDRTAALLRLLDSAGMLDDAGGDPAVLAGLAPVERDRFTADLGSLALLRGDGGRSATRQRRATRLLVLGAGRVGGPLAALLAGAGIGTVDIIDDSTARPEDSGVGGLGLADVGRNRGQAARDRLLASSPSVTPLLAAHPDLVVLAPAGPEQLDAARERLPAGVPHLLAEVRDTVGVVGPLVLPGRSTCLRCTELTRTDLDPDWPALAAQLALPSRHRGACDGVLAVMVAAQAALQVLLLVDGAADPASVGGTLELELPDWRWRRRTWPVHPDCGCAPVAGLRVAAGH